MHFDCETSDLIGSMIFFRPPCQHFDQSSLHIEYKNTARFTDRLVLNSLAGSWCQTSIHSTIQLSSPSVQSPLLTRLCVNHVNRRKVCVLYSLPVEVRAEDFFCRCFVSGVPSPSCLMRPYSSKVLFISHEQTLCSIPFSLRACQHVQSVVEALLAIDQLIVNVRWKDMCA